MILRGHWRAALAALMLLAAGALVVPQPAAADTDAEAQVRARLATWVEDFNAGRREAACDLFSRDLVSDVRGQGEADYEQRCQLISRALSDSRHTYSYALDIKDVLAGNGDVVVVRLDWVLNIAPQGIRTVDSGLTIFRKESDGAWRIVRFMTYRN